MRTSVSISADLRARMDAVEEPVNWSEVAVAAFEAKLAEIISRKGVKDMEDVIARLRASRKVSEHADFTEGVAAGEAWAKEVAEADELIRLTTMNDRGHFLDDMAISGGIEGESMALSLFGVIRPGEGHRWDDALEFWQTNVVGDGEGSEQRLDSEPFLRGFVAGATSIWDQVKDKL